METRDVRDRIEKYWVVIASISASLLVLVWTPKGLTKNISNVVGASIDISGILVGFLMTSLAILFALPENPFMKFLKDSRAFEKIIKYSRTSLWIWSFVLCLSLLLHYWETTDEIYRPLLFKILTIALIAGISAVARTIIHHTQMLLWNNRPHTSEPSGEWVQPGKLVGKD